MKLSVGISIFSTLVAVTALFLTYNVTIATQRAFVFLKEFQAYVLNDKLIVMPKWQNSGSTQTREMTNHVNWFASPNPLPDNYNFPDYKADGTIDDGSENIKTFIGPKGESFASTLSIPIQTIEAARLGQTKIYVYGWVSYRDVFWFTPKHTTKFCNFLEITGIEVDPQTRSVKAGLSFGQYKEHNSIDE